MPQLVWILISDFVSFLSFFFFFFFFFLSNSLREKYSQILHVKFYWGFCKTFMERKKEKKKKKRLNMTELRYKENLLVYFRRRKNL